MIFDFIAPHPFLVTITVWKLANLVIVDNFTVVLNVVEAFADSGANLVSQSAIIIRLK